MLMPLVAGCTTDAQHASGSNATIAFESIDGPPRPVFDRLVERLDAEARTRQLPVVSREAPARYRVRAYLAAKVERKRTTVIWVWDVYDSDLRRAMRIAGEETANRNARDGWAIADDAVLARIAQSGMTQLAAFAAAPGPAPTETSPAPPAAPEPARTPDSDVRVAAVAASAAAFRDGLR